MGFSQKIVGEVVVVDCEDIIVKGNVVGGIDIDAHSHTVVGRRAGNRCDNARILQQSQLLYSQTSIGCIVLSATIKLNPVENDVSRLDGWHAGWADHSGHGVEGVDKHTTAPAIRVRPFCYPDVPAQ